MAWLFDDSETIERANEFIQMVEREKLHPLLQKVCVMIPCRPTVGIPVNLARVLSVWSSVGISWICYKNFGGFLEMVRSRMMYDIATADKFTYFMMLDADMTPDCFLPVNLARHDKPFVSGCAMARNDKYGPQLCFTVKDKNGDWRMPNMNTTPMLPGKGLMEVGHVGTGCIMVRRDLAEAFSYTPGDYPFLMPERLREQMILGGGAGEDLWFCKQVRDKGFKIYVDLESHVYHNKNMSFRWPEQMIDDEMDPTSFVVSTEGMKVGETITETEAALAAG